MLQLDDITLLFGEGLGNLSQLTRLIRKQYGHGKNTIAENESLLHHRRHGDLFSKDAIMRSARELASMGHFDAEKVNPYTFVNIYKKGYKLSMKTVGNSKEIHLTALAKSAIPQMYIIVDNNTGVPSHVKMLTNGSWTSIVISNFTRANISDSYFSFNAKDFPKADIIDLR